MLVLSVLQGPDKGKRFEFPDDEPQLIGRSSEAIVLSDGTISRRHAELTPEGDGRWYINDIQSANGTFVNGVRVAERRLLRPGDQVRTGGTLFVYGDGIPTDAASRVRRAGKGELEVSVESTVASSDESIVMSSPDPGVAAQFQLRVIYELVEVLSTVTDKEDLFERVMDIIFEYFAADRGFVLLRDDPYNPKSQPEPVVVRVKPIKKSGETDRPGGRPVDLDSAEFRSIKYSHTIVEYVARKRRGVLSSNAMTDARFAAGDSVQDFHIHSAMCVPIRYKDRFYGVIHLDSQVANYTYTEDQLHLLTAIGVQSGLALANLRLIDMRLQAERLAAIGQTVASLSHSIKNILQGMRGGADVVEIGLRKEDLRVVRNGWGIVDRNLERIYELTMNMLTFSKQRKPDFEMTNLAPVLEEVVSLVSGQFEAKGVALITDFSIDAPPVPVDTRGIHQAVLNLLSNAVDAVEPESGAVTLRLSYDDGAGADGAVEISVTDNGGGIPRATLQRLFQPFHSTKGYGGTGLGLPVSKKIVQEHGGSIRVESDGEEGTTFTIRLPLTPDHSPASADTHGPRGS